MKALLTDNSGKLWLQEVALPETGKYECLVRMETCAFCHSTDRHIVDGTFMTSFPNPSILGHESVGLVEEIGLNVQHLAVGDRVLRACAIYPEQLQNGIGSAWGGFAEFGKVTDWQAMIDDNLFTVDEIPHSLGYMQRVPPDIPQEKVFLLTTLKEICSAAAKIDSVAGQSFIIAGAGITACFFGLFLKRRGAAEVTMVAQRRVPLDFALAHGAVDRVCLLDNAASLGSDYDGLIETTGNLAVTEFLADTTLHDQAIVYSYAIYENMSAPDFFSPLHNRWRFTRIDPAESAVHEEVIALLRAGELDPTPFVTSRFPFLEWEDGWRTVTGRTSLKTVLVF